MAGGGESVGMATFDALVRRWQAPLPMSLLCTLQAAPPDAGRSGAAVDALCEHVRWQRARIGAWLGVGSAH